MRGGLADGGERGVPLWLSPWNMEERRFHSRSNFNYWNIWHVLLTQQMTTTVMWIFTQILNPATAGTNDSALLMLSPNRECFVSTIAPQGLAPH